MESTISDVISKFKFDQVNQPGPLSYWDYPRKMGHNYCLDALSPKVVSIGPWHRKDENVQASEGLKIDHMNCLLNRMHTPKLEVLESCVRKVYSLMKQIKAYDSYWAIDFHDTAALVEMMLVDACFILEFMLQNLEKPHIRNFLQIKSMLHDLVLIENQIPFFVLDQIFQCTLLTIDPKASLVELLLPVLSCNNPFKMDINIKGLSTDRIPDILGLLHYCYRPQVDDLMPYSRISTILSTVDIHKAWVTLKPHKDSTSCLFMNYSRLLNRLTLTMPVLCVDDRTESILWNFIAYEQSCADEPYASHKPITSYIYSVCMLTRTGEDVAKLIDSGVLVNHLGSNEEAASIFNTILQYENKWKPSNKNCDVPELWTRSTYVSSPWNITALLALIIMFALVAALTIFTTKYGRSNKFLQYENKRKPSNKNCDGSEIWMRSTYVNSPWNIIVLLAVIMMFALVVAWTIFTTKYGGSNKFLQYENKWIPLNKNCIGSEIFTMSTYVGSPWYIIALLTVIMMFALAVAQAIFTTKYGGSNKWTRFLLFG